MDRGGLKTIIFLLPFESAFPWRIISGMFCISSSPADASSFMPSRPDYGTASMAVGEMVAQIIPERKRR